LRILCRAIAIQGPLPLGAYIRVTLQFSESGVVKYTSKFCLGIGTSGPAQVADLNTMAQQASTGFSVNLASLTPSDVALIGVVTQDMSVRNGVVGNWQGTISGTDVSPSPESASATIVQFHIATHYRGGHPKAFMPGGGNDKVLEPGSWTTAYATSYASGYQSMVTTANNHAYTSVSPNGQVAVSNFSGALDNSGDPSKWAPKNVPKIRPSAMLYSVQSISVNTMIGSQRRRRTSTGA
jgi:hypothetical protein